MGIKNSFARLPIKREIMKNTTHYFTTMLAALCLSLTWAVKLPMRDDLVQTTIRKKGEKNIVRGAARLMLSKINGHLESVVIFGLMNIERVKFVSGRQKS